MREGLFASEDAVCRDEIICTGMTQQVILQLDFERLTTTLMVDIASRRGLWRLTRYKSRLIGHESARDFQSSHAARWRVAGCEVVALGETAATGRPCRPSGRDGLSITRRAGARLGLAPTALGGQRTSRMRRTRRPIQPLSTRADTSSSHRAGASTGPVVARR